jgi:hypothetical protein
MADDNLPCMVCRSPTPRETLSTYGARCVRCYRAYCAEPMHAPERFPIDKSVPHDHAWAYRLRAKKAAGIRLSPAQEHCLDAFNKRIGK